MLKTINYQRILSIAILGMLGLEISLPSALAVAHNVKASETAPIILAEGESTHDTASSKINKKEEVVYVNLNAGGAAESIDVVNILDIAAAGTLTDYGSYSSVRNMTTKDAITASGDEVKISAGKAEKLYYEGRLANTESPWNVKITYTLNGREVKPEDLGGVSGNLKISLKITKNPAYSGPDFYNNYALQGSVQFDTNKVKNLVAEGATIANVGEKKQLTYIALPGDGADYTITAEVSDFEYDGFSINAIPLNLSVEIDDTELLSKVDALKDAISKLDDGAGTLSDGIKTLKNGVDTLAEKLKLLNSNSKTLKTGSNDFYAALKQVQSALDQTSALKDGAEKLAAASLKLQTSISQLAAGAEKLDSSFSYDNYDQLVSASTLSAKNAEAVKTLTAKVSELETKIETYQTQAEQLKQLAEYEKTAAGAVSKETQEKQALVSSALTEYQTLKASFESLIELLSGNNQSIAGTKQYIETVDGSIRTLSDGLKQLNSGYDEFNENLQTFLSGAIELTKLKSAIDQMVTSYKSLASGTSEYTDGVVKIVAGYDSLVDGVVKLASGGTELKDGTSEFRSETANLDTQITDKIDDVLSSIQGEANIGSFVSSKNTNVSAVQFVIKTAKISAPVSATETPATGEPAQEKTFWDRLLDLFR